MQSGQSGEIPGMARSTKILNTVLNSSSLNAQMSKKTKSKKQCVLHTQRWFSKPSRKAFKHQRLSTFRSYILNDSTKETWFLNHAIKVRKKTTLGIAMMALVYIFRKPIMKKSIYSFTRYLCSPSRIYSIESPVQLVFECKSLACSHFGQKRPLFRDPSLLFAKVAPATSTKRRLG
jgi:hypothetical protein